MPKKAKELSDLEVRRLIKPGMRMVGGVPGLGLQVTSADARSWILRVMVGGKRKDIGLGGYPGVNLAGARTAARAAREQIRAGIDPVTEARALRSALTASSATAVTFKQAAASYIEMREAEWRNAKHRGQWINTIATYAEPVMGNLLVRDIEQAHVLKVLEPLWLEKNETATRLRGRIESILDWARVRGYRSGENPARWRGHLDVLLQAPGKVQQRRHLPALPFDELAIFIAELRKQAGTGAKALEFAILTASRSGEVRGAHWEEINVEAATWTIPAERMKAGREHRVALNDSALALLKATPAAQRSGLVFPNSKGEVLSDMTLTATLRRMGRTDITAHGFRSTFRDWAAERTSYPGEVVEMALAHTIADKVEAAYRRGDLFEKRIRLMREWNRFCNAPAKPAASVTTIGAATV